VAPSFVEEGAENEVFLADLRERPGGEVFLADEREGSGVR